MQKINILGYIFKSDNKFYPDLNRPRSLEEVVAHQVLLSIFTKNDNNGYKVNNASFNKDKQLLIVGLAPKEGNELLFNPSDITDPEEFSKTVLKLMKDTLEDNYAPFKVLNDDEYYSQVSDPRVSLQGGAQIFFKYEEPKDEKDIKIEKLEQELAELKRNLESKEEKEADKQ